MRPITANDLVDAVTQLTSRSSPIADSKRIQTWFDEQGLDWGRDDRGRKGRHLERAEKEACAKGLLVKWLQTTPPRRAGWSLAYAGGLVKSKDWPTGWRPAQSVGPIAVEDLFADLEPLAFEEFVDDALRETHKVVWAEPDLGIDLIADQGRERWAIQVKAVRVLQPQHVRAVVDAMAQVRERLGDVHLVIAIAGVASEQASAIAHAHGIEVWDRERLTLMAGPALIQSYEAARLRIAHRDASRDERGSEAERLSNALLAVPRGRSYWQTYQNVVTKVFEFLFVPPLGESQIEHSTSLRNDRRDVIFPNTAESGPWSVLRQQYSADYVVVDAKNYRKGIEKAEVLSVAHYLKQHGVGLFGVIATRIAPNGSADAAIREQWIGGRRMVVVLTDNHLVEMLRLRAQDSPPEAVILQRLRDFRLSL